MDGDMLTLGDENFLDGPVSRVGSEMTENRTDLRSQVL